MRFEDIAVPEVYTQESADFRLFLRWIRLCFEKTKYDHENFIDLYDKAFDCKKKFLIFKDIVPELSYTKPSVLNKFTGFFKQNNSSENQSITIHDAIADMNIQTEGSHRVRVSKDVEMAVKLANSKRFGNMKLMY